MFEWVYFYPWVKTLHVVAVLSWMAGMLYMPRLFVYHCSAEKGSVQSETFKIMERRLYRAIMTPAMLASWAAGLLIAYEQSYFGFVWFYGKLASVAGMTVIHLMLGRYVRDFAADNNRRTHKFYRVINEIPTLLMIFAVIFVIVRPF